MKDRKIAEEDIARLVEEKGEALDMNKLSKRTLQELVDAGMPASIMDGEVTIGQVHTEVPVLRVSPDQLVGELCRSAMDANDPEVNMFGAMVSLCYCALHDGHILQLAEALRNAAARASAGSARKAAH